MRYNGVYYEGTEWKGRSVKEIVQAINGRADIYAGLMFPDIKDNFEQALDEAYNNGASGVSFFDGPTEEYLRRLKKYLDDKGYIFRERSNALSRLIIKLFFHFNTRFKIVFNPLVCKTYCICM